MLQCDNVVGACDEDFPPPPPEALHEYHCQEPVGKRCTSHDLMRHTTASSSPAYPGSRPNTTGESTTAASSDIKDGCSLKFMVFHFFYKQNVLKLEPQNYNIGIFIRFNISSLTSGLHHRVDTPGRISQYPSCLSSMATVSSNHEELLLAYHNSKVGQA